MPSLVYATYENKILPSEVLEKLNHGMMKIMEGTCEHTARAAYALRDLMLTLDVQSVALQSIKRLTSLKNHINDEQANSIFKTLFYVLKRFDVMNEVGDVIAIDNYTDDQENVLVMYYALDILYTLVKEYNIVWHESIEVLCVYAVVFDLLKRPNLTCKVSITISYNLS